MSLAASIKQPTDDEIREHHRKHLHELCLKSVETLRDIPELEEPNQEQQEFIKRKIWR